jgi:hypothetical protein
MNEQTPISNIASTFRSLPTQVGRKQASKLRVCLFVSIVTYILVRKMCLCNLLHNPQASIWATCENHCVNKSHYTILEKGCVCDFI